MSDTLLARPSLEAIAPVTDTSELLSIDEQLLTAFKPFYTSLVERGVVMDSLAEEAAALERERQFFISVYGGVMSAATQHDGMVTALFDVDNTIIEVDGFAASATKDVLEGKPNIENLSIPRPAFALVVKALKQDLGDRFEVGLLTTHSQEALNKELDKPSYLKEVRDIVNPTFVISSKDLGIDDPAFERLDKAHNDNDLSVMRKSVEAIADPYLLSDTGAAEVPLGKWYDLKLPIIDAYSTAHPERTFVLIDDLPSAAAIDPSNSRVLGVWVGPQVHDYIRRSAVEQAFDGAA